MDLHVPTFDPFLGLGPQYLPAWITAGATTPSGSRFHSTLHEAPSPFSKSLPNIHSTPFLRHKAPAPFPTQLHKSQPARPVQSAYSPGLPPLRRSTAPPASATPGRPNLSTFADRPAYLRSATVPPMPLPEHPGLDRSNSHSRARAPPFRDDPERLRNVRELRAEISKIVQEESANIERQVQEAARRSVDERKRMREREKERVWERLGTTTPISTKKKRRGSSSTPQIHPTTPSVRPSTPPRPVPHPRSSSKDTVMGPSPGTTPPGHDFIYEADPLKRKQGAKAWERWAEERVKVRRQEEDAWRHEEEAWRAEASQVEQAINEQATRSRSGSFRRGGDHQTVFEREQERRRVEDEQRRLEAERKMIAEQQRRAEEEKRRAEEEKRHIEEERRRAEKEQKLAEELRRLEEDNKRRAAERQKRQEEKLAREQYERQRQQDRERGRQRGSPERLREMFEDALREERHRMDQEWERLADNFIPPPTASRPRTPNRRASTPRQGEAERFREAWETYERRWASLLSSATLTADSGVSAGTQDGLRFSDIPWPVMRHPRNGGDLSTHLTKALISSFVLSPYRPAENGSTDLSDPRRLKKSRLREAMLRWHPDKFAKILARVTSEEDKMNIREGSEQVVRILNTLLASQATL